MKLPSLIRLPNSKKFSYEPRFYDPIKEEIEERTERIRKEMEAEASITADQRAKFKAEWQQTHERRESEVKRSNFSQLVFVLLFFFVSVGYILYGNNALYLGLILIPGYIFLRMRQMRQNS